MAPTVLVLGVLLAGCSASPSEPDAGAEPSATTRTTAPASQRVMQVTNVHEGTGMTLLEGPTFGPDGALYVVDVTAPPGAGKVLRVDVDTQEVETIYTDDGSALTSAQFGPADERLYVTDFLSGSIRSMTPEGQDVRDEFTGEIDGTPMQPDDVSFDMDGNLYVTDAAGARDPYWEPTGRIIRLDGTTGDATVLADELESPNGIGFSADFGGLWISLNTGNRIDHLTLSDDGTEVSTAFPAVYVSAGVGQLDSIAVDAAGNLYIGLHGRPEILVYDTGGAFLTTISVPTDDQAGLNSATNVAIRPGTTEAYATISGDDGGFLYTFNAFAEGIRQSNGG
ncbi:SMP-30/gluconolactonase/LRE family protein [Arthrobacter sp.]|uniref:SMP-30/gluconolactonase/LRE family protein n=1 Tax=Arthrobacter sp. TaxID=1667 RepID=UPI002812807A|nr:SMP-30/gluconolactonase/LRE family protein [Arthrobacter sp.]